jgi:hypothetical protein
MYDSSKGRKRRTYKKATRINGGPSKLKTGDGLEMAVAAVS